MITIRIHFIQCRPHTNYMIEWTLDNFNLDICIIRQDFQIIKIIQYNYIQIEHIEIYNTDKKGCKILNFVHQVSRKQLIKMDGHKSSRTPQVRETNRRARVDEYFRMKLQWKSMSEEQQNK